MPLSVSDYFHFCEDLLLQEVLLQAVDSVPDEYFSTLPADWSEYGGVEQTLKLSLAESNRSVMAFLMTFLIYPYRVSVKIVVPVN
jgi:hypothetical protein